MHPAAPKAGGWRLAVELPDEAKPFEREKGVDAVDRPRVRGDQIRQPAGRDGLRLGAELASNVLDEEVSNPRPILLPKAVVAPFTTRSGEMAPLKTYRVELCAIPF